MISKKNKLRKIIMRRLTVFANRSFFWALMGFRDNLTVKAPKAVIESTIVKTKIQRRVFCKLAIVFFAMGFNKNFRVRVPKRRFDEIHQKTR